MYFPSSFKRYRKAASTLAFLLLVAVAAATIFGVRLLADSNRWVEHSHRVIEHIESSQAMLATSQAAARGYRLTSHPSLREEFERTGPLALQAARGLVEASRDNPGQNARAKTLLEQSSLQLALTRQLIELQDSEGPAAAVQAMQPENLVAHMQELNAASEAMRVEEMRLLGERRATNQRNARLLLAFVLLSLAVSLATFWTLLVSLSRENRQKRALERETREALQGLQRSQAMTERLSEQRWALSEYTGMLQSAQNLDETMELTSSTFERLLPHLGGQCYVALPSRDFLESRASFGQPAVGSSDAFAPGECWALRRGQSHHNHRSGSVRCAHIEHGTSLAATATLCVPLTAHGETLGMLHASGPADGGGSDNDGEIIELLGEQLAMAIANLQLRETLRQQSLRDPLTGLFNRRYFEESLRREMLRCERKGLPLALMLLDIDHFKAFNDSHGHSAGDAVLAQVGRTIASLVRAEDMACRYGGEEFTVVMPETDAASAVARAEAIGRTLAQTTISHNGVTLGPVTLSIGVAVFPDDGVTPEVLFEVADASLYRAKAEGRNRVLRASPG